MSNKGINAERELIHLFNKNRWMACRVAGSGSNHYPSPDVLAGNNLRKLAIECKSTKERRQYLTKKEVEELRLFANTFGAEAWIAVRFNVLKWFFLNIEDLKETTLGFSINIDSAKNKGLTFEEIIK